MKHNRKYNIFGWLSATVLLLTTGCADTSDLDARLAGSDGENTVTFTITTEGSTVSTRVKDYSISDGSHVDVLKFAVYEVNNDGTISGPLENYAELKSTFGFVTAGFGQNVVDFTTKPYTFKMAADPNTTYLIAFWAQNSTCDAYDTSDLTKVEVKYKKADNTNFSNNDELRDAFCGNVTFSGSGSSVSATLYRPFAQVNVGTAGWDYEGAAALKPSPIGYTQSSIKFTGVARFYNVTAGYELGENGLGKTLSQEELDKVLGQTDKTETEKVMALTDVTFAYNTLPAFIHTFKGKDIDNLPLEDLQYTPYDDEEFLRVNLDKNNTIAPYYSFEEYRKYLDDNDSEKPHTETFKYLSMSYILVPEAGTLLDDDGKSKYPNATYGAILPKVVFQARGMKLPEEDENGEVVVDNDASPEEVDVGVCTINNVPVRKNWRTNILSDSFFITTIISNLYIVPDYMGDYNNMGGVSAPDDGNNDNKGGWSDDVEFGKSEPGSSNDWEAGGGKENEDFPEKDMDGGKLEDDYYKDTDKNDKGQK